MGEMLKFGIYEMNGHLYNQSEEKLYTLNRSSTLDNFYHIMALLSVSGI